MPKIKKAKPLAVCTICGDYTDEIAYVNSRCPRTVNGRRCPGIFRSGLGQTWQECESCKGYGLVGSVPCRQCKEFGWKLMR
jgi:hypothetical protein